MGCGAVYNHSKARARMAHVEIYSTMFCPFCWRAKKLLKKRGVEYAEIDVMADSARRSEMVARANGRDTVPQIFIDGRHIGGSDELAALERSGELETLLGTE
jgi:glutaredoxin 3